MDGKQFPHTRVQDMATYYIQAIQKLQPQGPYFLVGRCFGGHVAFEMAQQLLAKGQKIALLGVLDTMGPPKLASEQPADQSIPVSETRSSVNSFQSLAIRWRQGLLAPSQILQRKVNKFFRQTLNRAGQGNPIYLFLQQQLFAFTPKVVTFVAHKKARKDYFGKVYPGTITFFMSSDESTSNSAAKWARLITTGLDCHIVPGDHRTMINEPRHAKVVADKLSACLGKAQSKS
ncbi:MAG: thioesterase domain-containing protein [Leptolyngbyaceae cyanobacterium MO_188.B28]|nr:thioesterase domain-containing protein [Leptolyngbyaceae cyanobacterium MO_188.B28]